MVPLNNTGSLKMRNYELYGDFEDEKQDLRDHANNVPPRRDGKVPDI